MNDERDGESVRPVLVVNRLSRSTEQKDMDGAETMDMLPRVVNLMAHSYLPTFVQCRVHPHSKI